MMMIIITMRVKFHCIIVIISVGEFSSFLSSLVHVSVVVT